MRKIALRGKRGKGKFAIVDDDMFEYLSQWNWYVPFKNIYALRTIHINGKSKNIPMHRVIMNAPDSMEVDHKNNNGLDNRRKNLRFATHAQNQQNRKKRSDSKMSFKGIVFSKTSREKKYFARIQINGMRIHVGSFSTPIEAAKAYDKKAKELFGEFACLNFP